MSEQNVGRDEQSQGGDAEVVGHRVHRREFPNQDRQGQQVQQRDKQQS